MTARARLLSVTFLVAGCTAAPPPRSAAVDRIETRARLLRAEDTRSWDPDTFGLASGSPDPEVRRQAALSAGRLRDPEAGPLLARLLADPDAAVRGGAAFAAGVSGDPFLVAPLAVALSDARPEVAANAADALGKFRTAEATAALTGALGRSGPVRAAAAMALWRAPGPETIRLLAALAADATATPAERRAAVYALSRRPATEGAAARRAVLRGEEREENAEALAWAARAAGLLADGEAAPDLVRLGSSRRIPVAVQSLLALEKIPSSSGDAATAGAARRVAIARARDPMPGVAVAALRLLGSLPASADSRTVLEEVFRGRGWRGQTALVSLTRLDAPGDPRAAAARLAEAAASDSLEWKLGACESLEFATDGIADAVGPRLLSDGSARVRAAALGSLAKRKAPVAAARLGAALADPAPSVRAAALEAAAPLVDGPFAALRGAWETAFARSFASPEPDDVVSALDAAAARGAAGRPLVAARVDDPDAVVREKARRVMAATYGATSGSFRRIPVATGRTLDDYRALARKAEESGASVEISTPRGAFTVELDFAAAPLTADNIASLAGRGFFDGLLVHRVVPDFVVQTGDPRGDGTGGPGYALRDELNPLRYVRGAVGMALSGPDTGGSQWFVALSPQPHLDGGYTVFGRVTSGMEVLDRVEQDDRLLSARVLPVPAGGRR